MEKQEYYCLDLFGNYDIHRTLASFEECSHFTDILEKEYTTLDMETLRDDFFMQDDRIVIRDNSWIVMGSFPVIAIKRDNKLYDAVTKEVIEKYTDLEHVAGLCYLKSYMVKPELAEAFLEMLSEDDKKRYRDSIRSLRRSTLAYAFGLEEPTCYCLSLKEIDTGIVHKVYASEIDGRMVEVVTRKPIYFSHDNIITSHLTYDDDRRISYSEMADIIKNDSAYSSNINDFLVSEEKKRIRRYNDYVALAIPNISRKREEQALELNKVKKRDK